MNGFTPPGRLRLLVRWLGDQVYGILISLGWEPSGDKRTPPKM